MYHSLNVVQCDKLNPITGALLNVSAQKLKTASTKALNAQVD
jgi:hypothetical protein